jgi:hypothetical protein
MRRDRLWRERRPLPAETNRSLKKGKSAVAGFDMNLTGGPNRAGERGSDNC